MLLFISDTFSNFAVDYNTLDDNRKQVVDAAKSRGKEVVFFDIPQKLAESSGLYKFGGYYGNDGKIYVSKNYNELKTLVHELTHVAEASSLYTDFKEKVLGSMQFETWLNKLGTTKQQFIEDYINSAKAINRAAGSEVLKTDTDTAESEMIAKFCGEVLFTESGAKALMADTSLTNNEKKGIIRVILDFFKKIKARLSSRMKREIIELERLYTEMLDTLDGTETEGQGKAEIVTQRISTNTKFTLNKYSIHQIKNWENSKRIIIYESESQFRNFIKGALEKKIFNKKIYFGTVPTDLAALIKSNAHVDVEGYNVSLSADEIRKIFKDHGKEKTEAPRGQRAITPDDIINIPSVIQSPEKIVLSPNKYMGKPVINISKNIDGNMTIAAVVSDKHLDLFVQTAYVGIKKGNLYTPIAEQAAINTPEASSGTVSINSIPNSSENVNTNNKNNSSGQGKALLIDDAMYEDMKRQEQIDEETALFKSVTQEDLVTLMGLSEESPVKTKRRALKSLVDRLLKEHNVILGAEEKEVLYEQFSTIANALYNRDAESISKIFNNIVEEISEKIYNNIEWDTKRTVKGDAFIKSIKDIGGIKLTQAQKNEIAEMYGYYNNWYNEYGEDIVSTL